VLPDRRLEDLAARILQGASWPPIMTENRPVSRDEVGGAVITSAANPLVKRVRMLADRKHRRRESAFVVQGIQPVWQAVEAGADVEVIIVAPGLLKHRGASAMVAAQEAAGVRVARLADEVFGRIADRDGPTGLAAIVSARPLRLTALPAAGSDALLVALHSPGNPGNVGTIIRTASAAGAAGVILLGPSADPYDPVAVKASMGALFTMPVAAATAGEFQAWARSCGVTVAAASGRADVTCWEADLRPPLALLFGSEGTGLPDELLQAADQRLAIPMTGTAESLNLAVAAGILVYEVRRRTGLPPAGD
jgi:RNA methyltransferase, TrmH family